jgi:molybdate transport system ATP-binding protein
LHYLGIRQIDNILSVTIHSHDYAEGCSQASSFGLPLILPLRPYLPIGEQTQVSIRANDIALSRHYIEGISIQNQLKGRICASIPSGESVVVQVDCGDTLLVEMTHRACKNMMLQEGEVIYCLIKAHSINCLSEFDTKPILTHDNGRYHFDDLL